MVTSTPFAALDGLVARDVGAIDLRKDNAGELTGKGGAWVTLMSGLSRMLGFKPSDEVARNKESMETLLSYIERKSDATVRAYVERQTVRLEGDARDSNHTVEQRKERGTFVTTEFLSQVHKHAADGLKLRDDNLKEVRAFRYGSGLETALKERSPEERRTTADAALVGFARDFRRQDLPANHPVAAKLEQFLVDLATKKTADGLRLTEEEIASAAVKFLGEHDNMRYFIGLANAAHAVEFLNNSNTIELLVRAEAAKGRFHDRTDGDWLLGNSGGQLDRIKSAVVDKARDWPLEMTDRQIKEHVQEVAPELISRALAARADAMSNDPERKGIRELHDRLGVVDEALQRMYETSGLQGFDIETVEGFLRAVVLNEVETQYLRRAAAAGGRSFDDLVREKGHPEARKEIWNAAKYTPGIRDEFFKFQDWERAVRSGLSCLDQYVDLLKEIEGTFFPSDEKIKSLEAKAKKLSEGSASLLKLTEQKLLLLNTWGQNDPQLKLVRDANSALERANGPIERFARKLTVHLQGPNPDPRQFLGEWLAERRAAPEAGR
ncbi:MAG: hypothetical protein U1E53_15860 [Dongiaceae bacterium]